MAHPPARTHPSVSNAKRGFFAARPRRAVGLLAVLAALALAASASAQYTVGRTQGGITDPSGAALAGAQVILLNLETNAARRFLNGSDGLYAFFALPPGRYRVTAEAPQFAVNTAEVALESSETNVVNLTLALRKQSNGDRATSSAVQIDYTDANDWEAGGFAPGLQAISPDMLEQFKRLTGNFPAEYDVKSSTQIILVTKSGTNRWHGDAYDLVRNQLFNSRDYFDRTGKPSQDNQNIYGFTLGGPARKDRTVVFSGCEGRKTSGASVTNVLTLPTATARAPATDPTILNLMEKFLPLPTAPTSNPDLGTRAAQIPSPVEITSIFSSWTTAARIRTAFQRAICRARLPSSPASLPTISCLASPATIGSGSATSASPIPTSSARAP